MRRTVAVRIDRKAVSFGLDGLLEPLLHLPVTNAGLNSIVTFFDLFSKLINFDHSKGTKKALELAKYFFQNRPIHQLADSKVSDGHPKCISKFRSHVMDGLH